MKNSSIKRQKAQRTTPMSEIGIKDQFFGVEVEMTGITREQAGYGGGVYKIEVITHDQSSDIAGAVSQGNTGTQPKPSEAGSAGRGGARERAQFSPSGGNGDERTLRRLGAGDQGICLP